MCALRARVTRALMSLVSERPLRRQESSSTRLRAFALWQLAWHLGPPAAAPAPPRSFCASPQDAKHASDEAKAGPRLVVLTEHTRSPMLDNFGSTPLSPIQTL